MKINADVLIQLRKNRGWTQEELAKAAGLNLRTIQRIEKETLASLHSKKSLASAFNIDFHDLDYEEKQMLQELIGKTIAIFMPQTSLSEEVVKGEVLGVNDSWIAVKTKKETQYINTNAIKRIVVSS
jgi:DNA-binding XRE family transcriptional regulator